MKKEIQYRHYANSRRSYACATPTRAQIEEWVTYLVCGVPKIVTLQFGRARAHPEDEYSKAMGRDIAGINMEATQFVVNSAMVDHDGLHVLLSRKKMAIEFEVSGDTVTFQEAVEQ